ncbi:O-antigen ligase family protein [Micromonospora sp. NBC_01655]|uniref:O-antigen ligase family protein n=1 Tax=Micromonospora sp. NBC_01655 TaxID=2975983 RepID=UPI00224CAC6C|nr:O-antigen ligase family protein [Micromonospora sp. NBC_01655]MCX4473376.1 O-antigen ligase family protein [Micromonospora sp. NBC_01655]
MTTSPPRLGPRIPATGRQPQAADRPPGPVPFGRGQRRAAGQPGTWLLRAWPSGLPSVALLCWIAFWAARPPWWSFNWLAPLAVAALLLSGRLPRPRWADALAAATAGWAYNTNLWSDRPDLTVMGAYRYATVCLLFVACRHVLRTRRDLLLVGGTFLAGCVFVAQEVVTGAAEDLRSRGQVLDVAHRFGVEGREVNLTAYTLAAGIVVAALVTVALARHRRWRLVPLAAAALLLWAMLLTGSRGAAIGVLLGLAALLAARFWPRPTVLVLGLLGPGLLFLVPLGRTPDWTMTWLDSMYGRATGDISGRLWLWPYAITTWSEHPLIGSGPGVLIATNPYGVGPHNLLLTVGNDLGLIGVLLYFGTITAALVTTARAAPVGRLLVCGFAALMLPIWLTGQWEASPAAWLALAMLTVLPTLRAPAPPQASTAGRQPRAEVPASG